MSDDTFKEVRRLRTIWNEVSHDQYGAFVMDTQKRFYVDGYSVTEQEYRNILHELGLELEIIEELFTSTIYFSNPITQISR
jgi:protein-disulfide isomerase-like protein with CxxC motif